MASNTTSNPRRNVLVVAVTALLVASAVAAGVSLTAMGTASAAPTGIGECTTIDESGVYELTDNVTRPDVAPDPCFRVTASDVTLDGNGHTIHTPAPTTSDERVFSTGNGDGLENVTLRDVRLTADTGGTPAVEFADVTDGRVANVVIRSGSFPDPGTVRVGGDGNTITGITGEASLLVTGDDNRIVDTSANGFDATVGISVDGDRNLVRNVDANGWPAIAVSGADNRVANSSIQGAFQEGLRVHDATGAVVTDNTVDSGILVENSTGASIRDNDADAAPLASEPLALELIDSDDNTIRNNDLDDSPYAPFAFGLVDSDDNRVRGNAIEGIDVDDESGSNLIYDNVLVGVSVEGGAETNRWNVTPQSGENVIGGDTVAGNYYANADGTGFSRTCEDADGDGLCDSPNEFDGNNTDYAPLAAPDTVPVVDGRSPTDPDADGLYEDVDGDGTFAYDDVVAFFEQFRDAAVQDHEAAYDFDGSGGVTYSDVVSLFGQI